MRGRIHHQVSMQTDAHIHVGEAASENITKARGKTNFIYEEVTNRMIALLEEGTVPWRCPWVKQQNLIGGNAYRGINHMLLGQSGRQSPYWLTYRQMEEIGGRLKEDDKSSTIVTFWKFFNKEKGESQVSAESNDEKQSSRPPLLMYYRVFNLDQVTFEAMDDVPPRIRERIESAAAVGEAVAREGGGRAVLEHILQYCPVTPGITTADATQAYFCPSNDRINVPPSEAFVTAAEFYHVVFHELGHWTGPRLGRRMEGYKEHGSQSESYCLEELVADMTAVFACNEAGISSDQLERKSATYMKSWVKALQDDPKMIMRAAGQAQRAFDYLMGREFIGVNAAPSEEAPF